MLQNNIKGNFFRLIYNIYQNTKSCIQGDKPTTYQDNQQQNNSTNNHHLSEFFQCNIGERQGENLSPILFSLFLNDIEDTLSQKGNNGIDVGNYMSENVMDPLKLLVLLYADDTILLAEDPDSLQKSLNDFTEYCKVWKLNVNTDKTKVMIFGARNTNQYTFKIDNSTLEIVNTYK